jgi:hypothetical protein
MRKILIVTMIISAMILITFLVIFDYSDIKSRLNQGYLLGMISAAFFRNLPASDLTDKLLQVHNYTNGHLEILAELFNAEAELSLACGDTESSLAYTRKSLMLFEYVDKAYKTYSRDCLDKINTLRERLKTN